MGSNWNKAGANHVPSYQTSGIPYVTSSAPNEVFSPDTGAASNRPVEIHFPYVTKFVTINNMGGTPLRVAFSMSGSFKRGERLPDNTTKLATSFESTHGMERVFDNHFVIPSSGSVGSKREATHTFNSAHVQSFEIRCKSLFFMADDPGASRADTLNHATHFSLLAGLTTIPAGNFPILTGSVQPATSGSWAFEGVG